MEKLIAIRDVVLWWMGCWLACNLATGALAQTSVWMKRRRMRRPMKKLPQGRRQVDHPAAEKPLSEADALPEEGEPTQTPEEGETDGAEV